MKVAGHAMYEQSVGDSLTNLDAALSMGTHESQSLFWERHVGLSMEFWEWATPMLQQTFPEQFHTTSARDVYGAVNAVSPSLIRVEADELTYPLHVILRYNIEKAVIGGKLNVKDIPARWNADMKSMLNVDVPSDAQGCMQDVHWSALAFGYFPTYLIGSATAAQLAHYCEQDLGMADKVRRGEFNQGMVDRQGPSTWSTLRVPRRFVVRSVGRKAESRVFYQVLEGKVQ
jgi:carboxypeptidase Taq